MEPVNALAWAVGGSMAVARVVVAIRVRRPREHDVVVDLRLGATAEDLQRRLADDAVFVHLEVADTLLGPRLWLTADDLIVEVSLYRSLGPAWERLRSEGAVLRSCSFVEPLGWQVGLDTLDGPRTTSAWRVGVTHRQLMGAS